jgi:hypothetical protein
MTSRKLDFVQYVGAPSKFVGAFLEHTNSNPLA